MTIKELTDAVGGGVTPRMVHHYPTLGLLRKSVKSTMLNTASVRLKHVETQATETAIKQAITDAGYTIA